MLIWQPGFPKEIKAARELLLTLKIRFGKREKKKKDQIWLFFMGNLKTNEDLTRILRIYNKDEIIFLGVLHFFFVLMTMTENE